MKTEAAQALTALDETGSGLALMFEWRDDRWTHAVEVVLNGEPAAALRSLEDDIHSDWPTSPPFQQLSIELLEGRGRVGFLVGMAGKNHWSGSVEALPRERALVFDIACRTNAAQGCNEHFLGSSYACNLPFHLQDNACEMAVGESSTLLFSAVLFPKDALPNATAQIGRLEQTRLACQPTTCPDEKNSPPGAARSTTIRWKYRLALQDSGACGLPLNEKDATFNRER